MVRLSLVPANMPTSHQKINVPFLSHVHFPSSHLATQVSENVFLSLSIDTESDSGKQGDSWVVWKETHAWIPTQVLSDNCLNVSPVEKDNRV